MRSPRLASAASSTIPAPKATCFKRRASKKTKEPADELASMMKTLPNDPRRKFVYILSNVATGSTTRARNPKRRLDILKEETHITAQSTKEHNRFIVVGLKDNLRLFSIYMRKVHKIDPTVQWVLLVDERDANTRFVRKHLLDEVPEMSGQIIMRVAAGTPSDDISFVLSEMLAGLPPSADRQMVLCPTTLSSSAIAVMARTLRWLSSVNVLVYGKTHDGMTCLTLYAVNDLVPRRLMYHSECDIGPHKTCMHRFCIACNPRFKVQAQAACHNYLLSRNNHLPLVCMGADMLSPLQTEPFPYSCALFSAHLVPSVEYPSTSGGVVVCAPALICDIPGEVAAGV